MIKVLFICHGNICRSPMAEYVLRHLAAQRGLSGQVEAHSAATSTEEIGNGVHWGTRQKLRQMLPWQMKSTFIIISIFLQKSSNP